MVVTTNGWNKIKFAIGGNQISGILSIDYKSKVEMENLYGAGGKVLFVGEGNETFDQGSMELYRYEVDRMLDAIPGTDKKLSRIAVTPVTVTMEQPDGTFRTDTVMVRFPDMGRSIKQGDKMDKVTLALHVVDIQYNS